VSIHVVPNIQAETEPRKRLEPVAETTAARDRAVESQITRGELERRAVDRSFARQIVVLGERASKVQIAEPLGGGGNRADRRRDEQHHRDQ